MQLFLSKKPVEDFCGLDFYLRSLMRSDDLYPFIQGNRHLQTLFFFFNLIYPLKQSALHLTGLARAGEGSFVFTNQISYIN